MPFRNYLPSSQFMVTVGSLLCAAILIGGAQYITSDHTKPSTVASVNPDTQDNTWLQKMQEIQLNTPEAPAAPDETVVNAIRDSVKSSNLTDTVGKTLFINLANANSQGLGTDIPTQDKLVAEATAQLKTEKKAAYTKSNLTLVPQNKDSLHTYGNTVMRILIRHQGANAARTLYNMGYATDYQDQKSVDALGAIGDDYEALADELAAIPIPQELAPLHLQLVNDFAAMASVFPDMQQVLKDPLRGLAGLQVFQSNSNEAARVLTSIAQLFSKNAIIFNKDEAGSTWSVFLSS